MIYVSRGTGLVRAVRVCTESVLRERVVRCVAAGTSARIAARRFEVSASAAIKLLRRVRNTGSTAPAKVGCPNSIKSHTADSMQTRTALIKFLPITSTSPFRLVAHDLPHGAPALPNRAEGGQMPRYFFHLVE